jgi:protein involved in polysaccharide export with SLBB domain
MQSRSHHYGWFCKLLLAALLTFCAGAVVKADPSSANTAMPSPTVSSTYRLSPYDVIDVSVYNEDDLRTRARLGADGTVLLPLIGTVDLGGKKVIRPGIYEIPEGTHMSIVDAILMAGGFTRIADENGVKVKRIVKGKAAVFKVKAGEMADASDVAPFEIEPGDVIKVNESWW